MKLKLLAALTAFTMITQAMESPVRKPAHKEQRDIDRAIASSLRNNTVQALGRNSEQNDLRRALAFSRQAHGQANRQTVLQRQDDLQRTLDLSKQEFEREEVNRMSSPLFDINNDNNVGQDDLQRVMAFSKQTHEQEQAKRQAALQRQVDDELQQAIDLSNKEFEREEAKRVSEGQQRLNAELFNYKYKAHAECPCGRCYAMANRFAGAVHIRDLLDRGADLNAADEHGWTILHRVAQDGFVNAVAFLLERGANVTAVTPEGDTPLHVASSVGCAQLLVQHEAPLEARNNNGDTPLMNQIMNRHRPLEIVHCLLEYGASTEVVDNQQRFPLGIMLEYGLLPPDDFLLKRGVPINETSSVLLPAAGTRRADLCNQIVTNAYLPCPSKEEIKPIRERLKAALMAMRRISVYFSRDLRAKVLSCDPDLEKDLLLVRYYDHCHGYDIGQAGMALLVRKMPEYVIELLKKHMRAVSDTMRYDFLIASVFDPDTLESNFGQTIRANVLRRLGIVEEKEEVVSQVEASDED